MSNTIIITADDFGLSRGITDSILECCDEGMVNHISVVPTGVDYNYAVAAAHKRPLLVISVHLNLFEGKPLSPPNEVNLLVDDRGFFRHSFLSLWFAYLFALPMRRSRLFQQVEREIILQIQKVRESFGADHLLHLNGHQYVHLIPFVFQVLLLVKQKLPFNKIRIPREPFFFLSGSFSGLRNYFSANIIKHFLINALSKRAVKRSGVHTNVFCDYTIGFLCAGNMTVSAIGAALLKVKKRNPNASVEIIFHPGSAVPDESMIWQKHRNFGRFYYSRNRRKEQELLKNPVAKKYLRGNVVNGVNLYSGY